MRAIIVLIALALTACGSNSDGDSGSTSSGLAIPQECSLTATGAHTFLEWGSLNASTYSCATLPKMDCELAVSTDKVRTEILCENQAGQVPTVPTGCTLYAAGVSNGLHEWFDHTLSLAHAYDCGVWQNAARCFYFSEDSGTRYELRCLDI